MLFLATLTITECGNLKDIYNTPALLIASQLGRDDCVAALLLISQADMNEINMEGKTALMLASANGHYACVSLLITAHAYIKLTDYDQDTALILASEFGQYICSSKLTAANANKNLINDNDKLL